MMYTSKADEMALCGSPNHVIVYVMATQTAGLEPIYIYMSLLQDRVYHMH